MVLNKWDLVAAEARDDVLAGVGDRLAFLGQAPVLRISARTGRNVHKVLPALAEAVEAYHRRIPTGALNRALRDLQAKHPAPRARIRYGVQGAADPPTFTLFATARVPADYLRYVENQLRERFDLGPTPGQAAGAGGGALSGGLVRRVRPVGRGRPARRAGGLPDLRHGAHRGAAAARPLDLQGDARRLRHLPRLPRLPGDRLADPPRVKLAGHRPDAAG